MAFELENPQAKGPLQIHDCGRCSFCPHERLTVVFSQKQLLRGPQAEGPATHPGRLHLPRPARGRLQAHGGARAPSGGHCREGQRVPSGEHCREGQRAPSGGHCGEGQRAPRPQGALGPQPGEGAELREPVLPARC